MPYESVFYGPLLFALAIPDKDPNMPVADARWQYALDNEAVAAGADIAVNLPDAGEVGLAASRPSVVECGDGLRLAADGRSSAARCAGRVG